MANGYWLEAGSWEPTPRWHPARLVGWNHRRRMWLCGGLGDEHDHWEYASDFTVARAHLRTLKPE